MTDAGVEIDGEVDDSGIVEGEIIVYATDGVRKISDPKALARSFVLRVGGLLNLDLSPLPAKMK